MERASRRLCFGDFELDVDRGELRQAGRSIDLAPKPLALLIYLALNRERIVPKGELLEQVWPDVFVSETALSSALKDLRRALGDDGARMSVIETKRKQGYRFAAGPAETRAPQAGVAPFVRLASPPQPRFVGRRPELAWLAERVREAGRGRPRVAIVSGEAGVGKTRLLEELAREPSCDGFAVVTGRCTLDASLPYLPFVEALSSWLLKSEEGSDSPLGEDAPGLRQLLHPGAAPLADETRLDRFDGARDRAALFAAVFALVSRLAQRRPAVLVIEDLHAADAASRELLTHLVGAIADARTSGPLPLLIVATTRPAAESSALDALLARLQRETVCDALELRGLDPASARQLASQLGGPRASPRLLRGLEPSAAGNPLFLREYVRGFGGAGGSRVRDSGDGNGSGLGAVSLPRPGSLRAAIAARIAKLDESARSALVIAAFIGDRFGALALSVACRMAPEAVATALAEAAREGLVVGEGRSFRFDHGLVREELRERASEAERATIHRDLADVLEDLYASAGGEHALEIAHHLLRAGEGIEPARLGHYARRAADQAFAVCAWQEAGRFYRAAAESAPSLAASERAGLFYRAALSAGHDAQDATASRFYERAAELFASAGDDVGCTRARIGLLRARITTPAVGSGAPLDVRPLEELAERLDEKAPALSALALETVAEALWTAGNAQQAEATSARALVIGHNLDDDVVCHHASMGLALARFSQLRIREAVECWRESLAHARRTQDPWLASTPSSRIMLGLYHLGRLSDARAMAREALQLAERAQNRMDLSFVLAQETCLDVAQGEFAVAEKSARAALHAIERSRYPWGGPIVIGARACAAALRGAWLDAESALEELIAKGRIFDAPAPAMQFLVACYRALITAQRAPAEVDTARLASLLQLLPAGAADVRLLPSLCALAEAAQHAGDAELCARVEPALRTAYERGVVLSAGWVFSLARVLGGCAAAGKRRAEAEDWYDLALQNARAEGVRVEHARVLVDRARLRVERGDLDDAALARADLAEAGPLLTELALLPLLAEAERVAARLEL